MMSSDDPPSSPSMVLLLGHLPASFLAWLANRAEQLGASNHIAKFLLLDVYDIRVASNLANYSYPGFIHDGPNSNGS